MASITDAGTFLDRTESVRTSDHPRFVRMLEQVRGEAAHLTPGQQWHLRYLDAWETSYRGDIAAAEKQLQDVIDHSGSRSLVAKASALLMSNLAYGGRYEQAYKLANRLAADLPPIEDRLARFTVLANLSQVLNFAGQTEQALNYARLMEAALPPGESSCNPLYMEAAALDNGKRLTSSSPELKRAIDACLTARQLVFAHAMWLIRGQLLLDEGRPAEAMALLERIGPGIKASHFYNQMMSWEVELAQAHEKLGDDDAARKSALAAIAMSEPGDIKEWLKGAYAVLYRVEKKQGNVAAALGYYERFVIQDRGYLDDISARTLAYQTVQQQLLAKRLEAEALAKQNNILRLQQALDTKAVEASRLYNVLLLLVLLSIAWWLFRTKRSQLRFKKLARLDGLTGIYNHQHFHFAAARVLDGLERKVGLACLIVIDLDHFKRINDTHGHAMGDAVLRRTVAICQQQLRPTDLFGRLGGEEFGILLHDCSREQGVEIANRIRAAIAETQIVKDGCAVFISASVGLASTAGAGYGLQRLCKEADAALYRAKRAGRNCVMGDCELDEPVQA